MSTTVTDVSVDQKEDSLLRTEGQWAQRRGEGKRMGSRRVRKEGGGVGGKAIMQEGPAASRARGQRSMACWRNHRGF